MNRYAVWWCSAWFVMISWSTWAGVIVQKQGDTVVDPEALTIQGGFGQAINGLSFQQDALASLGTHQYVAYYDGNRRVCVGRRRLPRGEWEILRFADYEFKSNDAHNTISLGICPGDGTIHLAFDHHGHPLHYRVSGKGTASDPEQFPWSPSLFGPVTSQLERGRSIRITYPRFWQTPDGELQFCYRRGGSGNGDRMLVDYDARSGTWKNTRQIDSRHGVFEDDLGKSESRCSYPNGYDYGPGQRLHVTWVWRESSQGANHDLMYAYSEDAGNTWLNNRGEPLKEPPHVNSPGIRVVEIPQSYGLMNTHGQAIDSKGRVHVVMWHCTARSLQAAGSRPGHHRWGPPEARRYHHYWRDQKGAWHHRELGWVAGNRPKIFMDTQDNACLIFAVTHPEFEPMNSAEASVGDLVVATATAEAQWTDWAILHVEKGPFIKAMLGDRHRWQREGILSIMAQEAPQQEHQPTPLRVLDFSFQ